MLKMGDKITVRKGYAVHLGGDVVQEGESVIATAKNIDDLLKQEWKFEVSKGLEETETKDMKQTEVANRAILETRETKRQKIKKDKEMVGDVSEE